MKPERKQRSQEGPIFSRLMGFLAAMFFAVPTAALLWFLTNGKLAFWGDGYTFVGSAGLWVIIGIFAMIALLTPGVFPALLSRIWHAIRRIYEWL